MISTAIGSYQPHDTAPSLNNLESFLEQFSSVHYKKKEFIYNLDSSTQKIYFLVSGRVKLGRCEQSSKQVVTDFLSPNTFFGEQGLNAQREREEFAQAASDVEIKVFKLNTIREAMLSNGAIALHFVQLMAKKQERVRSRWFSQVHEYARTRIINFLIDEAETNGRQVGMEKLIMNFLAHHEIASLTGSSRQTVTIVLNELRKKNLIYFDRKRLLVRDIEALMDAKLEN